MAHFYHGAFTLGSINEKGMPSSTFDEFSKTDDLNRSSVRSHP
jgi:hypothetical protein